MLLVRPAFDRRPRSVQEAIRILRDSLIGAQIFDGDLPFITDTPPDPGSDPALFPCRCAPSGGVLVLPLEDGLTVVNVEIVPDRHNVMSYFGCPPVHLSEDQAARALSALRTGNRRRLLG